MATTYKNPPKFNDDTVYERWKNEIEVWKLMTDLDPKKQALAVTLSLSGKARKAALEIPVADLNKESGMKTLVDALNKVFEREEKDCAYEAYTQFDKYVKPEVASMSDFVIEFDRRYIRCVKYKMQLPDAVLAFKLLDSSGLDLRSHQMALTACGALTFLAMKSALNRIFSESTSETSTSGISVVKPEVALFTKYDRNRRSWNNRSANSNSASGQSEPPKACKGTNPLNKYGKRTKCAICESIFHWAKKCPHNLEAAHIVESDVNNVQLQGKSRATDGDELESCNITLLTKNVDVGAADLVDDNEVFVAEAFGAGILDTACTKTVCGEKWFNNYQKLLSEKERQSISVDDTKVGFKFGDGQKHYSFKRACIPASIGGTECCIQTEIVKAEIPLLLSKSSLKKAGTVMNLQNDSVIMFDKNVPLQSTTSGHYCVNLCSGVGVTKCMDSEEEPVVMAVTQDMSEEERKRALLKLHKQFGHASAERLCKLLRSAGDIQPGIQKDVTDIVDNCEVCLKFKRPPPKPAVGFPLATRFNETVAVDLHQLEKNLWCLHIIDEYTRFSAGGIMKSKRPQEFVSKFIQLWIGVHGPPEKLYSDNGGEFCNDEVKDMAENFNIEVKNTAAESP
jgi:hypothetical protein